MSMRLQAYIFGAISVWAGLCHMAGIFISIYRKDWWLAGFMGIMALAYFYISKYPLSWLRRNSKRQPRVGA